MEQWVDIPGYEDLYQISDHGNVLSKDRVTSRVVKGRLIEQPVRGRILKQSLIAGYPALNLSKNGEVKSHYIHHLVAQSFIPPGEPHQTQVCHDDGNPLNTHYTNFRYDTPTGNARDRLEHGTDARGENNPRVVLGESDVINIRNLLLTKTIAAVSRETGFNYSTVRNISNGNTWSWLK